MDHIQRLGEVSRLFLRLGLTAFGGPAAHIALIDEECVRRRQWLTREQFLDVLGVANLIPGPTSTELAMHVGLHRAGWLGLLVAGTCFIAPAALIVGVLAALYAGGSQFPAVEGILRAVKPVVVVVVLMALVGLARGAVRSLRLVIVTLASLAAAAAGAPEIAVLIGAGVLHGLVRGRRAAVAAAAIALAIPAAASAAGASVRVAPSSLFFYFVKAGSEIFGSGYVLFAILRTDLVDGYHWLTQSQLLDAIAVGQVTPGPVFTSATFLGYLLGGTPGAVASTIGIFLPAFVLTAVSARALHRLRESPVVRSFLEGVNAAAVALIALVVLALARSAIVDAPTALIALVAAVLVGWLRVNSSWVLLGAVALGWLLHLV